ncbi:type II CAAX endopeptidase family protein [Novosphingobium sp.]|uniref:CPBP family intramembrane glutamic endopeptidase n=1 Tax=Novosphingobium sp. TaxID=1874826 RepID=UPI0025D1284A|nr:type II CAAX endopeptidase family protein [Novosphingobium sp.]MCC6924781.1 CPBP family intramembrane metalloprotease [Novosphingobium sp.]
MLKRIVRFPLSLLVLEALAVVLVASLYSAAAHRIGVGRDGPLHFVGALGLVAALIGLWKLLRRFLEGEDDRELVFAGAPRELGAGLLTGLCLFSLMTAIVALLDGFEVLGLRGWGAIWPMAAMAVTSGTFEEMLFRGVLFRHIESMLGSWAALGITSVLFGAAHLSNPGSSIFAAVAIALEAGVLLGAAYMVTRRLWLAIGIHVGWNFTQGWIFSIPVSGGDAPIGLLVTRRLGPDWLTGGEFGLEASVVAMVVATTAGVMLLARVLRNHGTIAPMWRRPGVSA